MRDEHRIEDQLVTVSEPSTGRPKHACMRCLDMTVHLLKLCCNNRYPRNCYANGSMKAESIPASMRAAKVSDRPSLRKSHLVRNVGFDTLYRDDAT